MTSHRTSFSPAVDDPAGPRRPVRLRLSESPGRAVLDGGWWPQTRDIGVELADLVDHFPVHLGRVHRALYSSPDWNTRPRSVPTARGRVKTGSFPRDDTHLVVLRMSTRTSLRLLVVPPEHPAGALAMGIAADPTNRWSAAQIVAAGPFTDEDAETTDQWNDDGGNWWLQGSRAPSFR
jgi:hypothetical protein